MEWLIFVKILPSKVTCYRVPASIPVSLTWHQVAIDKSSLLTSSDCAEKSAQSLPIQPNRMAAPKEKVMMNLRNQGQSKVHGGIDLSPPSQCAIEKRNSNRSAIFFLAASFLVVAIVNLVQVSFLG
jgi:hypothetical protein